MSLIDTSSISIPTSTPTAEPNLKDNRVALRMTGNQKALIEEAAATSGSTVSEFAVRALVTQAEEILADRRHFQLSDSQYESFLSALDAPVEIPQGLLDLFNRPSLFRS